MVLNKFVPSVFYSSSDTPLRAKITWMTWLKYYFLFLTKNLNCNGKNKKYTNMVSQIIERACNHSCSNVVGFWLILCYVPMVLPCREIENYAIYNQFDFSIYPMLRYSNRRKMYQMIVIMLEDNPFHMLPIIEENKSWYYLVSFLLCRLSQPFLST